MNPDITIEIEYTVKTETATIRTNAKHEYLDELLGDYLQSIIGSGVDETPRVEKDTYKITLGVELADDSWGTNHDCGNRGLRDGIVLKVFKLLAEDPSKITFI